LSNPNILNTDHKIAVISALWYYQKYVLNSITVDSNTTVDAVTIKVNGGANGLPDRKTRFNKAQIDIDCN